MAYRPSALGTVSLVGTIASLLFLLLTGFSAAHATTSVVVTMAALLAALSALILIWRDRKRYMKRMHQQEIQMALAAERMEIARDLHDIVSHGLGLITMRAAVATWTDRADPAELASALEDIEVASRATTVELRRMLLVLRGEQAPLNPAPGTDQLPALILRAREAGLDVRLIGGDHQPISEGVSVAAYRIIQECLANSAKHAGPTWVEVTLSHSGPSLVVEVQDGGGSEVRRTPAKSGHGLLGVHERVTALGGTVTIGRNSRGFRVKAVLPDQMGELGE